MTKRESIIFVTGIGMGMRAPLKGPEVWGKFGAALGLTHDDTQEMLEILAECEAVLFADGTIGPVKDLNDLPQ